MTLRIEIFCDRCVLLVHDVVNSFLDPTGTGYDAEIPAVLANISALLAAARQARLAIMFAAPGAGDKGLGPRRAVVESGKLTWGTPASDVPASLGPLPGETILRKPRYGAFFGSSLAKDMREAGRDTMIICGLSLAGGIETSVRDAQNHELRSILVADSCLCRPIPDQGFGPVSREDVARVTLSVLAQRFARIASTAEICRELQ